MQRMRKAEFADVGFPVTADRLSMKVAVTELPQMPATLLPPSVATFQF
jgi:hypothetical protein